MRLNVVLRCTLGLAAGILLANCSGGNETPTVPQPHPGPGASQHAYVTVSAPGATGVVLVYNLPLTASSTPAAQFPVPTPQGQGQSFPGSDCADTQGDLFVAGRLGSPIYAFTPPITSSSTAAFVLNNDNYVACGVDLSGNLYVIATFAGDIFEFDIYTAPVHAGSTSIRIASQIDNAEGVAIDSAGDVFTTGANSGIQEWSPRSSGNKLLANFGAGQGAFGDAIGPDGNLYVANTVTNGIDVYHPGSFRDGGVKDHTISLQGMQPHYIAFDASGNMIVTASAGNSSALLVLAPPYATITMSVPTSRGTWGIAITI